MFEGLRSTLPWKICCQTEGSLLREQKTRLRTSKARMAKNHHEWYISKRPKKSRILVRLEPYSARYCWGVPFCKIIVPKTDVVARKIRRKIVSLSEEKMLQTTAFNPVESLFSKMAPFQQTANEKCQTSRTQGKASRARSGHPGDLEIAEIFNIPRFWCQPKRPRVSTSIET